MEAEYMALCEARKEAVWLNKLVESVAAEVLWIAISGGPINIKVDNSGCIDFTSAPSTSTFATTSCERPSRRTR